ncbi:hypothetical protein DOTSEDRAFT_72067 [Dothistroma septosporum NZE10]|uniref:Uncharacterized protein n=1 Tax=Dothistroma septosporum (strain NZE10 / CBS 128990) TaxID=675120 RepID=N1PLU0_DOTSN|nr:hypothetical protein DOTSEDRAFT_72067 [Dothistroma septosporum NZE10]
MKDCVAAWYRQHRHGLHDSRHVGILLIYLRSIAGTASYQYRQALKLAIGNNSFLTASFALATLRRIRSGCPLPKPILPDTGTSSTLATRKT